MHKVIFFFFFEFEFTLPFQQLVPSYHIDQAYENITEIRRYCRTYFASVTLLLQQPMCTQLVKLCTHTHWRSAVYPLARFIVTLDLQLLTALDEQGHTYTQCR